MGQRLQLLILGILSLCCITGHIFSPPEWDFAHEFLFKCTYLPIILSGIWFGRWFALQLTTLFCLVYVFHIFIQLYHHSHHHLFSISLDLGLYFMVAWVTGLLSDAQKDNAHRLSEAYQTLKEKTAILLEFEKEARKSERLKIMGELAATVAHEVRTPLSALQGAVEIVVSEKSDEETRKKFSAMVFREVQRINQVVGQFLKLGITEEKNFESFSFQEFLNDSLSLLIPVLKKKNISFEFEMTDDAMVKAEKDSLKQVIINLVMNASHAMEPLGGRILISIHSKAEQMVMVINDTGKGVPFELQNKLFESFVTDKKEGSGLGLYLSKNIVRSFGGDLCLEKSEPGCTKFKLSLPLDLP